MSTASRYEVAILRNHAHLHNAVMLRTSIEGMDAHGSKLMVFSQLAYEALWYMYLSRLMKVFERKTQAASFWYLYRCDQRPIDDYARRTSFDLGLLEPLSDKLKIIRDRVHFHIDGDHSTNSAYHDAAMPWEDLRAATDFAYGVLSELRTGIGCTGLSDYGYVSMDAQYAAEAIERSASRHAF